MEKVRGLRAFKIRESPFLIFFLLLLIPFTALFLRPDFVGFDTYGFLAITCQNSNVSEAAGIPFIAFRLLPCNFFALKVFLFALCFVSGAAVIKMATLFSPKNGWRASYLLFLSSTTVLEFSKLENDQLAFPLLFVSLYLFFKALKKHDRAAGLDSLGLVFVAAAFWEGAVFYLIGYTLNVGILALFSIPAIIFFRGKIVSAVLRTVVVAEDLPFQFHIHFLANFGLLGAMLSPLLLPQAVFFFALGVASAKFWILSLPFLVVGAVLLLERIDRQRLNEIVFVIAVFSTFGLAQSVWLNPPQPYHWETIDYALEVGDNNINNDWGLGYLVKFRGGETESYMSPGQQQEFSVGQVIVSEQVLECPMLKEFGKAKVYKC